MSVSCECYVFSGRPLRLPRKLLGETVISRAVIYNRGSVDTEVEVVKFLRALCL